jgi:hypothetical protein
MIPREEREQGDSKRDMDCKERVKERRGDA